MSPAAESQSSAGCRRDRCRPLVWAVLGRASRRWHGFNMHLAEPAPRTYTATCSTHPS
ncbi:MAG: hypothetical protein ACRDR6_14045 [Pseudonocardiaceae bacterium]